MKAESNVFTQQFIHRGGIFDGSLADAPWLANQTQEGAEDVQEDEGQSSHSILSFFGDINKLKEGTYIWNGQKWELQDDKK
ncbi:MAG: hypothetical protein H6566_23610 [Lewinellaceae bacterium]|nr:hypothetical protein [Lewinellaceae bacterium]